MAEKEPMIVIKKINVQAAGAHGGSWKVAFADFMTAMMAFFLCMWLLAQSEEVKKQVSDYFSTPSVIEYNFSNYGVELTLEKIFLDLLNEPLKLLNDFVTPADFTPNFLSMGSKNIVMQNIVDQLGDVASSVKVNSDEIIIEIPDKVLFKPGTATTSARFIPVMENIRHVTAGLEDAYVYVDSIVDPAGFGGDRSQAEKIGEKRLDIISGKMETGFEHESVDLLGRTVVDPKVDKDSKLEKGEGSILIKVKQKDKTSDGRKPRKLEDAFGSSDKNMDVYNNFVKQISNKKVTK
jgi:chemotaxis protein MotB